MWARLSQLCKVCHFYWVVDDIWTFCWSNGTLNEKIIVWNFFFLCVLLIRMRATYGNRTNFGNYGVLLSYIWVQGRWLAVSDWIFFWYFHWILRRFFVNWYKISWSTKSRSNFPPYLRFKFKNILAKILSNCILN